jgi:hypothetical protein
VVCYGVFTIGGLGISSDPLAKNARYGEKFLTLLNLILKTPKRPGTGKNF